jgi:hypothetical protein
VKNSVYEQALTKQGVAFTYHESVDIADIDTARGLRNQARLVNPIEEELVEQYAAAYRDKMEFPPVVLWRPGKGRFTPIDGNNRLAACAKAKKKWHDAYVVECADRQVVDRLTWTFNNLVNGKRLSREECVEHAVSFVLKYGYPSKQAATEWGVPEWVVTRNVRTSQLRDTLRTHNVKVPANFPEEHINTLGPLKQVGEDLFVKAAKVAIDTGIGQKECEDLVKQVKGAKTSDAKVKVIDDYADSPIAKQRRAETKGGRVRVPQPLPRTQLARLLQLMQRLFEDYPAKEALRPPGPEYKTAREVAADVADRLIVLFGLGATVGKEAS